jgi:hypothetical protein
VPGHGESLRALGVDRAGGIPRVGRAGCGQSTKRRRGAGMANQGPRARCWTRFGMLYGWPNGWPAVTIKGRAANGADLRLLGHGRDVMFSVHTQKHRDWPILPSWAPFSDGSGSGVYADAGAVIVAYLVWLASRLSCV